MSDTGSSEPLVSVSCPKGQVEKYVNVEACKDVMIIISVSINNDRM